MSTIAEITKVAKHAIDEAYEHYFIHLTAGEQKIEEIKAVAEMIMMMQPWLFFTETALEKLQEFIYTNSQRINLVYSLTALFRQRFTLEEEDYKKYIDHLATSFNTQECEAANLSMMAVKYQERLTKPEMIQVLLQNNRPLVMLASTMLYFDTNILKQSILTGGV